MRHNLKLEKRMRNKLLLTGAFLAISLSSAFAAEVGVDQTGQKFAPDSLTLKSGDTVTFNNKDDVKHNINIVSPNGDSDDKGIQAPGEAIKAAFPTAGEYQVRCKIHPKMKMTVVVQ